jgi:hypothetical protein
MAYDVNLTDGSRLTLIADRTLDTTSSIKLLGRNYPGYGEIMAENMVQMLEHFAKNEAPENALRGQVWFDIKTNTLMVYDGDMWSYAGGAGNNQATAIDCTPILDTLGRTHNAIKFKVNGQVVVLISQDDLYYTPAASTGLSVAFPEIGPGLNMNVAAAGNEDSELEGQQPNTQYKLRGRSIEAEFADLAEIYQSDCALSPGDIVKIGGSAEITLCNVDMSTDVFGVISTAPAFLLNSVNKTKDLHYPVALTGRVPVKVIGKVNKGDRIVASDIPGVGKAVTPQQIKFVLQIVGRALEAKETEEVGLVEVVVGVR